EDALGPALRASLGEEGADFAAASGRARPFVVVRGVAARAVLRDRLRAARRAREETRERLGKAALDGSANVSREAFVQDAIFRARDARARLSALVSERAALLAPSGGSARPAWRHGACAAGCALAAAPLPVRGTQSAQR